MDKLNDFIFYYNAWNNQNGTWENNAVYGFSKDLPAYINLITDTSTDHPLLCHHDFNYDSNTCDNLQ